IDVERAFEIEKFVSYKLSAFFSDINKIYNVVLKKDENISDFVSKLANIFLPPVVYQLEEYGLPRTISRKIHFSGVLDFEQEGIQLAHVLARLNEIGLKNLEKQVPSLKDFDIFILKYFYE
ncbi:MAG TPA: hypothetical protein PK765_07050, partial [bacterium]|nr:hypothetical protein [bacterium]